MLDVLICAVNLSMRDGSGSSGFVLSNAAFVAPMAMEDSALQLARCLLDWKSGAARLSGSILNNGSAQRYASASIQRRCIALHLRTAPVHRSRSGPAAIAVQAQHSMGPRAHQHLAQAVPAECRDGTMLPVAPLDCTLQLSAFRSHGQRGSSHSHAVLVLSGVQCCKAPAFAMLPDAASSPAHWASAAADGAQDSSSHRLTAAGDDVLAATALEGVQFKTPRLPASGTRQTHPAALAAHDLPQILYELCPAVVSPASSAAADGAPSPRALLQLRSHWPASAASAALMALQTLSGSDEAHGAAGQQATLLEGGDLDVAALLRTVRLEQPQLGAALTGTMVASHLLHFLLQEHARYRPVSWT